MTFKTHVPMEKLEPDDARRILAGLSPVLETLRGLAAKKLRAKPPRVPGSGRPRSGAEQPGAPEPDASAESNADSDSASDVAATGRARCTERLYEEIVEGDLSEAFSDGTPSLGHFPLESVHALAEQEWHRRLDRAQETDPRARALIAALVVYALKPESPVRQRAAEWNLETTRRALEDDGLSESEIERHFCELSCALWHVLLTAGIAIERAVVLRDAIDGILLAGVEDRSAVTAFSPALGPLTARPSSVRTR